MHVPPVDMETIAVRKTAHNCMVSAVSMSSIDGKLLTETEDRVT